MFERAICLIVGLEDGSSNDLCGVVDVRNDLNDLGSSILVLLTFANFCIGTTSSNVVSDLLCLYNVSDGVFVFLLTFLVSVQSE